MVRPKKNKPEEELEEFEEQEDEFPEKSEEDETKEDLDYKDEFEGEKELFIPARNPEKKEEVKQEVVAIPRVVSVEEMLNELYTGQQEIKQALYAIFEKLK